MPKANAKPQAAKPIKLQVNTNGAWKDVITFDGAQDHVSDEVMDHAHYLGIHGSGRTSFRLVAVDPLIGVLAHWTSAKGWKKEQRHATR